MQQSGIVERYDGTNNISEIKFRVAIQIIAEEPSDMIKVLKILKNALDSPYGTKYSIMEQVKFVEDSH